MKSQGTVYTADRVAIAYEHRKAGFESVVIVCPGFFNSKANRWMQYAYDLVSKEHDAIVFDFRGHGSSGGKFSWLAKEHLDLEAVLNYAKTAGYRQIGVLAFSLGAAASINLAAERDDINRMVLISSPTSFWKIDYHFWKPEMLSDLKDNIECNWEAKGARVASFFSRKRKPIKEITKIKSSSILFIHGASDWVIKDYHSRKLYEAARVPKRLEIIEKGLHAERLFQQYPQRMRDLILGWLSLT